MKTQEQVQRASNIEIDFLLLDKIIADDGFPLFVEHIFSKSTDIMKDQKFTMGEFVVYIATWLGKEKRTLRVSAKDHFKSMSFYAHIMWKIYRLYWTERSREINYFSYGEGMASYHLVKVKAAIKCNPYFEGIIDLKHMADSILSYSWDGKKKITVNPRGLLEFKRGIHCNDVYVDDPFQDPESKMVPTKIKKINDIMKTQILDMFQDECHIAGTAQTNHDFFFDEDFVKRFSRLILPAVKDQANKIPLWPEWMNWEELMSKKAERGEKIFNQEYLCSPVYAENAFVDTKDRLYACVNAELKNHNIESWKSLMHDRKRECEEARKSGDKKRYERAEALMETELTGGWDLGKKNHPAHFTIYEKRGDKRVQVHDRWFDRVDYTKQLEHIESYIEVMRIDWIYFDSTRGEMEMLEETGELPGEMEGVAFTFKSKHKMAEAFDRCLTNKKIEMLNIPRSLNQMLIVNNDLQAPETPEGHGDSFWSTCLTFNDLEDDADISFA